MNQAALKAAMDGEDHVTMEHLEYARDKILMGERTRHAQRAPQSASRLAPLPSSENVAIFFNIFYYIFFYIFLFTFFILHFRVKNRRLLCVENVGLRSRYDCSYYVQTFVLHVFIINRHDDR